jgi:leucyl/phenylalanyl-tRNA--protein transferase
MTQVQCPEDDYEFPPSSAALDSPNGLIAVGGELCSERLMAAYRRGIFPWYESPQPVMWWTPDPRSVLPPDQLHISRSLRKTLLRGTFQLTVDHCFSRVIEQCAATRKEGPGTWIGDEMRAAYTRLHRQGVAHSVEVWDLQGALVGGLYGVSLGRIFFGESMFSTQANASKVAMVALAHVLKRADFALIDCQLESEHLNSLGARNIDRLDFERLLDQNVDESIDQEIWTVPLCSGELL